MEPVLITAIIMLLFGPKKTSTPSNAPRTRVRQPGGEVIVTPGNPETPNTPSPDQPRVDVYNPTPIIPPPSYGPIYGPIVEPPPPNPMPVFFPAPTPVIPPPSEGPIFAPPIVSVPVPHSPDLPPPTPPDNPGPHSDVPGVHSEPPPPPNPMPIFFPAPTPVIPPPSEGPIFAPPIVSVPVPHSPDLPPFTPPNNPGPHSDSPGGHSQPPPSLPPITINPNDGVQTGAGPDSRFRYVLYDKTLNEVLVYDMGQRNFLWARYSGTQPYGSVIYRMATIVQAAAADIGSGTIYWTVAGTYPLPFTVVVAVRNGVSWDAAVMFFRVPQSEASFLAGTFDDWRWRVPFTGLAQFADRYPLFSDLY